MANFLVEMKHDRRILWNLIVEAASQEEAESKALEMVGAGSGGYKSDPDGALILTNPSPQAPTTLVGVRRGIRS